jgi:hypothetical protein
VDADEIKNPDLLQLAGITGRFANVVLLSHVQRCNGGMAEDWV